MSDEPVSKPQPSEEAPAAAPESTPAPTPEQSGPQPALNRMPNSVTVLVGIAVALLAAILALNLAPRDKGNSTEGEYLGRLKAERDAQRATVNAQRAQMGLPPLDDIGGAEDPNTIATRIGRDSASLASMLTRYDQLIIERDAMIAEKGSALVESEKRRQLLADTISRLQNQLDKALIEGGSADLLQRQVEAERARAEDLDAKLQNALASLANTAGQVDKADYDRLVTQLEEARRSRDFFEDRSKQLEAELASLQSVQVKQDLFADDESELLPAAVALFRELRRLENQPDADIMAAYSKFGNELGATVLRKLSFPTGSSELTAEDLRAANELAPNLPDRGLVFAVGYASVTGNVDKNRELSSARATNVARAINGQETLQPTGPGRLPRPDPPLLRLRPGTKPDRRNLAHPPAPSAGVIMNCGGGL
jgi:outer membrane protein OmpA-like peptidoglycan-associated protein